MWRFWWSGLVAQRFGETFPFGTLVVNMVGSTIIGIVAGFLMHVSNSGIATALQQLLVVGICGGLTTFSSFSLQTYNLIVDGRWLSALSNMVFLVGKSHTGYTFDRSVALVAITENLRPFHGDEPASHHLLQFR